MPAGAATTGFILPHEFFIGTVPGGTETENPDEDVKPAGAAGMQSRLWHFSYRPALMRN
jgi:hypothetical protein